MLKRFSVPLVVFIAGALILSACATAAPVAEEAAPAAAAETSPTAETATEDKAVKLSGDVLIDGSSTVYPITVAVAEEFIRSQPDFRPSVGLSGTGGGFKKFCPGKPTSATLPARSRTKKKPFAKKTRFNSLNSLLLWMA